MFYKIIDSPEYIEALFKEIPFSVDGQAYYDLGKAILSREQLPPFAIAKIQNNLTDQQYSQLYKHKLRIENRKRNNDDIKTELIDNFPEWQSDIEVYLEKQHGYPKGIGIWLMQRKFAELNLLPIAKDATQSPVERILISLYDHGFAEWNIIQALLNDSIEDLDQHYLGIPHKNSKESLSAFWRDNKQLFNNIDPLMINNFLWPFLLLHDIGKYNKGDEGHLPRSRATIHNLDLSKIMSSEDKYILAELAGYHSDVESKDPSIRKNIKDFLDSIPDEKRLNIVKIWVLFRIAERAFSEIFGFMDPDFWKMINNMYDELMTK